MARKCVKGQGNESFFKGTFSMGSNDYLYHGSTTFFDWPFDLKNIDNRLTPSKSIAFQYATKNPSGPREGFIYQYILNPELVKEHGGIPNVFFACGRWSEISDKVENEIKSPQKVALQWRDSKFSSPVLLYSKDNTNPVIGEVLYKFMISTDYWGIYTPGYENQIVLRPTRNILKCINVYFVKRDPKFEKRLDENDYDYITKFGIYSWKDKTNELFYKELEEQKNIDTHKRKREDDDYQGRNVRQRLA